MAEKQLKTRFQLKIDTEENWSKATNFIPKKGEPIIYEPDSTNAKYRFKIGDGSTLVNSLDFAYDIDSELSSTSTNPVQNSAVNTALFSKAEKGNFIPVITATYSSSDDSYSYYTATVNEWSDANTVEDLEGRMVYIKLDTTPEKKSIQISFNGFSNIAVIRRVSGAKSYSSAFNDKLELETPLLALIGKANISNTYVISCIALDRGTRAYGASDFSQPVNIDKGGTGATTPEEARTNLDITPATIGAAALSHTHSYLPLSGGTMTGAIITPGDDSAVIRPPKNNYDTIGSSNYYFYRMYSSNYYLGSGTADMASGTLKIKTISAPTSSGGSTYGKGDSGQALLSNGTTVYWGTVSAGSNYSAGDGLSLSGTTFNVSYGTSAKALGTSSAGSASTVSRSDHVHALPALTSCTGTLTIDKGGTGATTAASACSNLGAVKITGDTMTGNLEIQKNLYPSVHLIPTNSSKNIAKAVIEGSYAGTVSMEVWGDNDGTERRLIKVQSASCESSLDQAVVLTSRSDGHGTNYRIFHAGMETPVPIANGGTGASSKSGARTNLGITSGRSLPTSGSTGDIFFLY